MKIKCRKGTGCERPLPPPFPLQPGGGAHGMAASSCRALLRPASKPGRALGALERWGEEGRRGWEEHDREKPEQLAPDTWSRVSLASSSRVGAGSPEGMMGAEAGDRDKVKTLRGRKRDQESERQGMGADNQQDTMARGKEQRGKGRGTQGPRVGATERPRGRGEEAARAPGPHCLTQHPRANLMAT